MSSSFADLFDMPLLTLIWVFMLAFAGGPLLWKFLNYRPVTRCAVVQAAANFVGSGCWLTFGTAAMTAHQRGLISLPTSILLVASVLACAAGSSFLIERWCPDEQP
ncbi:hypothetical protein RAD16_26790 [Bradyrhizobium sp. 18BD]